MRVLKVSALFLLVSVSLISCQKEPDETIIEQPVSQCKMVKSLVYDETGEVFDTMNYVYTGNRVTKILETYNDGTQDIRYIDDYIYTGDKLTKILTTYDDPLLPQGYQNLFYSPDGLLIRTESSISDPGIPVPVLFGINEYQYSGSKLVSVLIKEDISSNLNQPPVPVKQLDFNYTGDNITRAIVTDLRTQEKDTSIFTFDNSTNHYKSRGINLAADVISRFNNVFSYAFTLSRNNVLSIEQGGSTIPIAYQLDDKKNLQVLLFGGQPQIRYFYECQ